MLAQAPTAHNGKATFGPERSDSSWRIGGVGRIHRASIGDELDLALHEIGQDRGELSLDPIGGEAGFGILQAQAPSPMKRAVAAMPPSVSGRARGCAGSSISGWRAMWAKAPPLR